MMNFLMDCSEKSVETVKFRRCAERPHVRPLIFHAHGEPFPRERLGQNCHALAEIAIAHSPFFGVAGDEQHFQLGTNGAAEIGDPASIHAARKTDIGDEESCTLKSIWLVRKIRDAKR